MIIGVPKEIKIHEYRVGLVPSSVYELVKHGHRVMVESGAGEGIQCSDQDYAASGADIAPNAQTIFQTADMIVKVKEPSPEECKQMRPHQIIFTYLHLAADPRQAQLLCESHCTAIGYETVTDPHGTLPLLAPMSEVAGRLSIQAGVHFLEKVQGGSGILLSGVPGVSAGHVVVIGGGVVGTNAILMAIGMHARVTVIDKSLERLKVLDTEFGSKLNTVYATTHAIEEHVADADLLVGAVLVPGAAAPKLVTREMIKRMRPGSVIVDVAIDQGGCMETSRPTSHAEPTFIEEGVIHYCVTNMPGTVPRTSTYALNDATLPFVLEIANKGVEQAMKDNQHLKDGLNVFAGKIVHPAVLAVV